MNKNTKILIYGRRVNGRFDSFKAKMKRLFKLSLVGLAGYVLFMSGAFLYSTSSVVAEVNTVQLPVVAVVLERIADCESGNGTKGSATQLDRNGQVLMRPNANGTVDVGKYQINTVWFKKASELGFDLTREEGNKAMGEWIYLNKGTGDWSASAKCWQH